MAKVNNILIRKRRPWDLGTWIWLLNRIAGVVIVAYLIIHICVISTNQISANAFNSVMGALHNRGALFLEFILIMAVLAHGVNGLRHILIDFGLVPPAKHMILFGIAAAIGALFFFAAISGIWPAFSGGR